MNFAIASPSCHIRWMTRRDMLAVLSIEYESSDDPWDEDDFIRCLRKRNCMAMVAERRETICGYMIYEVQKYNLHLFKLAVRGSCRRSGVGASMVNKLKTKLSHDRRSRIITEVNESNLGAQLFLREMGFKASSVLSGFFENGEDAYFFRYRFGSECVGK